jgi:hypothetical protein
VVRECWGIKSARSCHDVGGRSEVEIRSDMYDDDDNELRPTTLHPSHISIHILTSSLLPPLSSLHPHTRYSLDFEIIPENMPQEQAWCADSVRFSLV